MQSTMSQERLNGLSMISIEKDMVDKLDYETIMYDFAGRIARKYVFSQKNNCYIIVFVILEIFNIILWGEYF